MSIRSRRTSITCSRWFVLACLATIGPLALTASPALATLQPHHFVSTFNASDAPAGARAPLQGPFGIAVDDSGTATDGDVYIGAAYNGAVDVFDASGKYHSQIIGSETVQGSFTFPWGVAVDQSNGDLYVTDISSGFVNKFDSSGKVVKAFGTEGEISGSATPQGSFSPTGVAVDPTTDELYVGDNAHSVVDVFDSEGKYLRQFSSNGGDLMLAADSQGNLFATNGSATYAYVAATGALNTAYGEGSGVLDSGGSVGVGVDPANDDVYVADRDHIASYDKTGTFISSFGQGHLTTSYDVGVGDTAAKIYVADEEAFDVAIFYRAAAVLPTSTTGEALEIDRTSATLQGSVNPEGLELKECTFEYGEAEAPFEHAVPCEESPAEIGTGDEATPVEIKLTGLIPAHTYHFRLTATNVEGTEYGSSHALQTPAVSGVKTVPPTNVERNTASLHGVFAGDGEPIKYYFEWGPDDEAGFRNRSPEEEISSSVIESPSFALTDLSPGVSYHYRLVATNADGIANGAEYTFSTEPPLLPVVDSAVASEVTASTATLSAQVKPGFGATAYRFQYGTSTSYEEQTPPSESIGSDNSDHAASVKLSELTPGTTYYFRVLATNLSGTTDGSDQTFTTIDVPTIEGVPASNVTKRAATLNAKIDPALSPTTYYFEYGPTASYGSSTVQSGSLGSDSLLHAASADISGLAPATTYHFRAVATNAVGISQGQDQAFTTALEEEQTKPPSEIKCHKGLTVKHGRCVRKAKHKKHHKHGGMK